MENIKISNIADINHILDYVHDRIFQLSDIRFDPELGVLVIPLSVVSEEMIERKDFLFFKTWRNPVLESELIFKDIVDYQVIDNAHIGEANINKITQEDSVIIIVCSVPVELRMTATNVDIELRVSEGIIKKVKRFSLNN